MWFVVPTCILITTKTFLTPKGWCLWYVCRFLKFKELKLALSNSNDQLLLRQRLRACWHTLKNNYCKTSIPFIQVSLVPLTSVSVFLSGFSSLLLLQYSIPLAITTHAHLCAGYHRHPPMQSTGWNSFVISKFLYEVLRWPKIRGVIVKFPDCTVKLIGIIKLCSF